PQTGHGARMRHHRVIRSGRRSSSVSTSLAASAVSQVPQVHSATSSGGSGFSQRGQVSSTSGSAREGPLEGECSAGGAKARVGSGRILGTVDVFVMAIEAGLLTVEQADADKLVLESRRFEVSFASFRELVR